MDISWNENKNKLLKKTRNICYEDIVVAMSEGRVLADIPHNNKKYLHQKMLIVEINNYAYVVPYVVNKDTIFFKTIYPSRIATKRFLNIRN